MIESVQMANHKLLAHLGCEIVERDDLDSWTTAIGAINDLP